MLRKFDALDGSDREKSFEFCLNEEKILVELNKSSKRFLSERSLALENVVDAHAAKECSVEFDTYQ